MENRVRPDTLGIIEQMNARYEFLPGNHVTVNNPATFYGPGSSYVSGPKVPMREYEMLNQIYQAQNAVGIAKSANAAQYAPDVLAKAETLLNESRRRYENKGDRTLALQEAREASQTAETARILSEERMRQEAEAQTRAEATAAYRARADAEARAAQSRAESQIAQAQADAQLQAGRAARLRAEADAAAAREQARRTRTEIEMVRPSSEDIGRQKRLQEQQRSEQLAFRARLLEELNATGVTIRDTPRGLVAIVPDSAFSGSQLLDSHVGKTRLIANALVLRPGLQIEVEGHSDSPTDWSMSRAKAVMDVLQVRGLLCNIRDMSNTRPLGPNNSFVGRQENRRVEIVISGPQMGTLPLWDRSYTLSRR
jgi:flagellar motor protein MotB